MSEVQSEAPRPESRAAVWLAALTVAAFAVRVGCLLLEPQCGLVGDEASWVALGTQELGRPHRGLSPFRVRLIFYPPLYPYFVAVLHRAFSSLSAVLWIQAAVGALLVPAVARAGRVAFSPRAGLVAAALVAFYPDFVWFSVHFWSETLFIVLLWWALERVLRSDAAGATTAAAAGGALWGLATLTRELTLYLAPFALLWLLRRGPRRPALRRASTFALGLALTLLPWTVRNAIVFHAFIPVSTMGGSNLWQGNVPLTHLEIHAALGGIEDPVERDRKARKLAWEVIRARQPGWIFEKLREQMPEFWKAGSEILDHAVSRAPCRPLSATEQKALEVVVVGPYLAVLALSLVGLARARPSAGAVLLLVLLAAWNMAHVAAYATTRFRLPLLPVLFLFAAAAMVGRRDGPPAALRGGRAVLLAALVALAGVVLGPGLDELALWRALVGLPPL
jgi:4-amino-4-deoxy-L-arabinose transferase-like glycosyltransferase